MSDANPYAPPPAGGPSVPPYAPPPQKGGGGKGCLIAAGVGCGVLVLAVVGIALFLWFAGGRDLVGGATSGMREGAAYGAGVDEMACMDRSVPMADSLVATLDDPSLNTAGDTVRALIGPGMWVGMFVNGCLQAAEETPGFCDGASTDASDVWAADRCVDGGAGCQLAYGMAHSYCTGGRRKGMGGIGGVGVEGVDSGGSW